MQDLQTTFLDTLWHGLNPIAFTIGPIVVRWYAIAYVVGFVIAGFGVRHTARKWGLKLSNDAISIIMSMLVFGVIVGARLGYVLAYGNGYFWNNPGAILATWRGGMSFHGGLVGAVIAIFLSCRWLGVNYWTFLDMLAIWAPAGLFLGRCANFVNGELWGKECDPSAIPWAVAFESGGGVYRHPSQLYEALLEGALLLVVMLVLSRRKPLLPQWTFSAVFLIFYGTVRFLMEFVRVPDVQLGYLYGGWLTMGQLLSVPMIVIGIIWLREALAKGTPQHVFLDHRDEGVECDAVAGDISAMADERQDAKNTEDSAGDHKGVDSESADNRDAEGVE